MHEVTGHRAWWGALVAWLLVGMALFVWLAAIGEVPIDFQTYLEAAERLERGDGLYPSRTFALETWRRYHRIEEKIETGRPLADATAGPPESGPYLYPPTLALLVSQFDVSTVAFGAALLISVASFVWIWLERTGLDPIWLLLVALSWDVNAALSGGNVELLLLGAAILASWQLWVGRAVLAGPLIAFVVLIKPFYGLFFVAFLLIALAGREHEVGSTLRTAGTAACVTTGLVALEIYRWGTELRHEALAFLGDLPSYTWLTLPASQQTPMSAWNRTPLQALVNLGLSVPTAQLAAAGLWVVFTIATVWAVRRDRLDFPGAFGLSLLLLYWGRPVGWTLSYLEIVVVGVTWPALERRGLRRLLLVGLGSLMVSHWLALGLTLRGNGLPLFTLQSASFPWETWIVLPLCWLLLLYRARSPDLKDSTGLQ